jgi:hypothetical protein
MPSDDDQNQADRRADPCGILCISFAPLLSLSAFSGASRSGKREFSGSSREIPGGLYPRGARVPGHKIWVFTISGVLIASDFFYVYWLSSRLKAQGRACSNADGPSACGAATRVSRVALWVAAGIYVVGFFTAYLLGPILVRLNP